MPLTIAILLLFTALLGACLSASQPERPVLWPDPNWMITSPEAQGVSSETLLRMVDQIQARQINLHSLLIARNGAIVFEAYFDPYRPETPHELASLTKTVIGALVGIALKEGKIDHLDVPVIDFFPGREIANLDERKQALTVRHLLTLTDGFECDNLATEAAMEQSADWVQFVLDLPMRHQPGQVWNYCSASVHLLSAVLSRATGQDGRTYANERLFKPLGISEVPLERWPSDPQGVTRGSNGLLLTPRELAKFALLYVRGGEWDGVHVLPKEWVNDSLSQHAYAGTDQEFGGERGYGYQWSVFPHKSYRSALGMGGQHIHILPEKDLVVIYTASTMTNRFLFELLDEYILPAAASNEPLPPNPQAFESLAARVRDLTYPQLPVAALPETARRVSGLLYQLEPNPAGWRQIMFEFRSDSDTARLTIDGGEALIIGLDNIYRISPSVGPGFVGLKGTWKDENRFVLREIVLGSFAQEYEAAVQFSEDTLEMVVRNTAVGGIISFKGKRAN